MKKKLLKCSSSPEWTDCLKSIVRMTVASIYPDSWVFGLRCFKFLCYLFALEILAMGTQVRSINPSCVTCYVGGLVYGVEDDLWIDTVCVSNTTSVLVSVLQRYCIAMCLVFWGLLKFIPCLFCNQIKKPQKLCLSMSAFFFLFVAKQQAYFTFKLLDLERSLGSWYLKEIFLQLVKPC